MKRLGALLGLWLLVWTRDHDGEVRLRIARKSPWGWWVKGISGCTSGTLSNNGDIANGIYLESWAPYKGNWCTLQFLDGTK